MDKIKQWTLTVSAVSIISGILLSLIPESKAKPAFKALVSIVLVYSFMLPLADSFSVDFNIGEYLKENYSISEELDKYALKNTVASAEKAIEEALTDFFADRKITCEFSAECSAEGEEIVVEKITVSTEETQDEIKKLMCELGFSENIIEFKGEADED